MINKKYFFIGIGGIGMSSIAQYLHDKKNNIFGYDRSINRPIKILLEKGINITNKLDFENVPKSMLKEDVIVIYTPAVSYENAFLKYFRSNGNSIYKRSEILDLKLFFVCSVPAVPKRRVKYKSSL